MRPPFHSILAILFCCLFIIEPINAQVKVDSEMPELDHKSLYGWSVSSLWERVIVTAPNKIVDGVDSSGVAYSMILSGGRNPEMRIDGIIAPEPMEGMKFGISSALGNVPNNDNSEWFNFTAIGAKNHPDSLKGVGAVYLYKLENESNTWVWRLDSVVTGNDTKPGDNFAHAIQFYGYDRTLFISAPSADGENANSGAVYVFEFDGQKWIQKQKLIAEDGQSGDQFGYSISSVDFTNYIVIGAYNAEGDAPNSGAIYIYEKQDSMWIQTLKVTDPEGETGDQFGYSITHLQEIAIPVKAVSSNQTNYYPVFVGAPKKQQTGSVFYYKNYSNDEDYKPFDISFKIKQDSNLAYSNFGKSIAANSMDGLIVAADSADNSGRIYRYGNSNFWNWFNSEVDQLNSEIFLASNAQSKHDYSNSRVFSSSLVPFISISNPISSRDISPNTGEVEFFYTYLTSTEETLETPDKIELNQNYPNPFNPTTIISFHLPQVSTIELKVFDTLGREITTLADNIVSAGYHEYNFDASGLSSGVYFYELKTNNSRFIKKMMLIK